MIGHTGETRARAFWLSEFSAIFRLAGVGRVKLACVHESLFGMVSFKDPGSGALATKVEGIARLTAIRGITLTR